MCLFVCLFYHQDTLHKCRVIPKSDHLCNIDFFLCQISNNSNEGGEKKKKEEEEEETLLVFEVAQKIVKIKSSI